MTVKIKHLEQDVALDAATNMAAAAFMGADLDYETGLDTEISYEEGLALAKSICNWVQWRYNEEMGVFTGLCYIDDCEIRVNFWVLEYGIAKQRVEVRWA